MKKTLSYLLVIVPAAIIILLASVGPSVLTGLNDQNALDRVETQPVVGLAEGFRYSLNPNERLYILSMALQNRAIPQTDFAALIRGRTAESLSSYVYTENRSGPSFGELTLEEAQKACGAALSELTATGAIPECLYELDNCETRLYTAVELSDPQKNISVWQITTAYGNPMTAARGALLEAWLDAEDGTLYAFALRTETPPEAFDPDAVIRAWCGITGLTGAEPLTEDNPLLETTPHYRKYVIEGAEHERTVVTVGYYEGINEIILRIT
ncbi:MAG: hypothetical protein FWG31_05165 [Oscillospiraceae bacterium]|nr:hypothetical protein [Oscillospiraceae bacterium]